MEERRAREEARREREKAERNETLRTAFAERLEALAPLAWQQGGILIRPCAAPEELDAEGRP